MKRLVWTSVVAGVAAVLIALGSILSWVALDSPGVTFAEGGLAGSATMSKGRGALSNPPHRGPGFAPTPPGDGD